MTGVLALLLGSAAMGLQGHRLLQWLGRRRVDPTVLLVAWVGAAFSLGLSTAGTIALLVLPADEGGTSGLWGLVGGCWTALASGALPGPAEALAAIGTILLGALLVRIAWVGGDRIRRRRRLAPLVRQLRQLAGALAPEEPLWVAGESPFAVSIGGRRGLILISEKLRDELPPAQLAATLEHERAHLRGRHHLLLAGVETLAQVLPLWPLLRVAPATISDLVEYSADAHAARGVGATAVQEALRRVTQHRVPSTGTLGMAGGQVQIRLVRLAGCAWTSSRTARLATSVAAAILVLLLPALSGWTALSILGCALT